ncbi:phosphoglycerate mutase (2,3-diphosphoglycerate-independent) [Candidatus Woesebacteria bacterium RIFCSPLOWO2_01_FULL_44_14]|uniref:2,3-bisphosphoglycerate-independent phosphoglycerate mutase n=1 Tax=Candidatus Woesebacteria bacterium RIFCSPLOWO2_01_FULL_44_14 TaxID=1802525 RepID=A0A1F8C420_9BACT|nr:MAG: phosphoglycerate mutase (2,3-diphosphoglycerate-independent) [Candidatus Woesebacteria bacterium RIFCSPLOWO2_01_FULL_44_14]
MIFANLFGKKQSDIKPVILLILDGWGLAPASAGNAISLAKKPNWDRYVASYPYGELIASGESVGLPANEDGNSEVGHLTIGAGRAIKQSLPRIEDAIKDGTFMDNNALLDAVAHVKKNSSKLHVMGLVSHGSVHSSLKHFWALLDFCKNQGVTGVCFHLFTDGRDAAPTEAVKVVAEIEEQLKATGAGSIATVTGRYFSMDRDGKWERTQKAYEAMVMGKGQVAASATEAIQVSYAAGITDEFIQPTVIHSRSVSLATSGVANTINDNDAVIFFNFRIDRPRQLTMAFVFPDFENLKTVDFGYIPYEKGRKERMQIAKGSTFKREKIAKNLFFVTMTEYQKSLPVSAIAFPPEVVSDSLPEVLAKNALPQMHLAESEKERMVTFYFNGMSDTKFPGEEDVIVASPRVATYDQRPQMSVGKLVREFKKELRKQKYSFFVVNFANPDMVAHSGNLKASIRAVEIVDRAMGELVAATLNFGGTAVITADHGNAEELLSFPTGSFYVTTQSGTVNTEHSGNPVPILVINKAWGPAKLGQGMLADVAPTILAIMKIAKPAAMTGRALLTIK